MRDNSEPPDDGSEPSADDSGTTSVTLVVAVRMDFDGGEVDEGWPAGMSF